jgi:nucleoside-diphosphate-sugar epimerase
MALSQGLQKLDFIYVKDIARAYVLCLERADALAPGHEALNIGSGFPSSLRDVVSVLEELLGRPIRKRWGVPSAADFDITFADRSRARERLGWEPTTDLFQGLGEILAEERRRLG